MKKTSRPDVKSDEVNVVTPTGKPVKSRIPDAPTCWRIFDSLKKEQESRARDFASIQGLIDGNPPRNPKKLRARGEGWRSNINTRQARAHIRGKVAAYMELITDNAVLVQVRVDDPEYMTVAPRNTDTIADEFSRVLQRWDCFLYEELMHLQELNVFGVSALFFPDADSWQYEAARRGQILIPSTAKAQTSKVPYLMIMGEIEPDELIRHMEEKDEGWNTESIRKALVMTYWNKERNYASSRYRLSDWQSLQETIKNCEWWNADTDSMMAVPVIHVYWRENDGTVTRAIMFDRDPDKKDDYLYKQHSEAKSMGELLHMFTYDVGTGYMKTVTGMGHEIYQPCEVANRLVNQALDGGVLMGGIVIQPTGVAKDDNPQVVNVGATTVIPDGYAVPSTGFGANVQGMIGLTGMLEKILNQNTGVYRDPPTVQTGQSKSTAEIVTNTNHEARFEKTMLNMYYLQKDRLYQEVFRRLCSKSYPKDAPGYEDAKLFRSRCEKRGVPVELLDADVTTIKCIRMIGHGSASMRLGLTADLFANRGAYPEAGQNIIKYEYVAARAGADYAQKIAGPLVAVSTMDDSVATLETNDMLEGSPVSIGDEQDHVKHFFIHLKPASEIGTMMQQNPDAINRPKTMGYLQQLIAHNTTHAFAIERDEAKAPVAAEMKKIIGQLQRMLEKLSQEEKAVQVERQAAAQEAQAQYDAAVSGQMSEKNQIAMAKLNMDFQLKLQNQQNLAKIREATAQHKMQIKNVLAMDELRRRNVTAPSAPAQPAPQPGVPMTGAY